MNWISVKDKLPDYSERVILFDGHITFVGIRRMTDKAGEHFYDDGDGCDARRIYNVSHWMPLPLNPKW